jgi:hypothetical protein
MSGGRGVGWLLFTKQNLSDKKSLCLLVQIIISGGSKPKLLEMIHVRNIFRRLATEGNDSSEDILCPHNLPIYIGIPTKYGLYFKIAKTSSL